MKDWMNEARSKLVSKMKEAGELVETMWQHGLAPPPDHWCWTHQGFQRLLAGTMQRYRLHYDRELAKHEQEHAFYVKLRELVREIR